jgi:hypothetical protein
MWSRRALAVGRQALIAATAAVGTGASLNAAAACHGRSNHADEERLQRLEQQVRMLKQQLEAQHGVRSTTGQGDAIFSWEVDLTSAFPEGAKPFEKDMHGGFNEDKETSIVYTGIPGYGLCAISPDLKTWQRIGSDDRLKGNVHGLCVFKNRAGESRLALAQNEDGRVLIVGTDGTVHQELVQPRGGEFDFAQANAYYSHTPSLQVPWGDRLGRHVPKFAVTDVTFHEGQLYAVTGYCDGDFVLTASEGPDGVWAWGPIAWGGKGEEAGKFQTAHGIFAHDGSIFVANREAHQVVEFTPTGRLVRCLPDIPDGARICNLAHTGNYYVMNALEPIPGTPAKTAPIYAHSGERLLSTIEPGDLGIPVLKHLHNVWPHYVTHDDGSRTLHLLVHGWSAGKYAVLKHEPQGVPSAPNGWNRASEPLQRK